MSPHPPAEDPFVAAARALARRDRGLSAHEHGAYLQWLLADPAHAAAIATLEQTWRRLDLLRALCPQSGDRPDPDLLCPLHDPRAVPHPAP